MPRQLIEYDLVADRFTAFLDVLPIVGVNWGAPATFRSQIRLTPDAPSLVANLLTELLYAGSDTVANHVAAHRLPLSIYSVLNTSTGENYIGTDVVTMTQLKFSCSPATMSGLPPANETGDDLVLAWDLLIDVDGGGIGTELKYMRGAFIVRGTVTQ